MAGLGYTLDIAKNAINANQYALSVTGHNIANVNTPGYCRQTSVQSARASQTTADLMIGNGVETTEILRSANDFVETKLREKISDLASYEAAGSYMTVLENLFNEDSEGGMGQTVSDFWNSWHDLANNPTGSVERIGIYENGFRLSNTVKNMEAGLVDITEDLNRELDGAVGRVNEIASQIKTINEEIVRLEGFADANDQRDQRNLLLTELAQLTNIKTMEQLDGSVTVTMANGAPLVMGNETYALDFNDGRIEWMGADITDKIESGQMAGWLDMRDETIPKYRAELDVMAREMIWEVNQQQSQGVGMTFFATSVTGTYSTDASGLLSALPYGNKIDYDQDFKMWIQDSSIPELSSLEVDMGISDAEITSWGGTANADASPPFQFVFTVERGGEVNAVANAATDPRISWKKLDVAGNEVSNGSVDVNETGGFPISVDGIEFEVGPGDLVAGNTFTINTDAGRNADPLDLTSAGRANSILDNYSFKITSTTDGTTGTDQPTGKIGEDTIEIEWSNSVTSGKFTLEPIDNPAADLPIKVEVDGMMLAFDGGTVFEDEAFTISSSADGTPSAELPSGPHWTLNSFIAQFNREKMAAGVTGITAYATSGNQLAFRPDAANYSYAFAVDDADGMVRSDRAVAAFPLTINAGVDDQIDFKEDPGGGFGGLLSATIAAGAYNTGADLAAAVETAMEAASANGIDYQVTYDEANRKFLIEDSDAAPLKSLQIDWETGINSAGSSLGFVVDKTYDMLDSGGGEDSGLMAALGVNTFFSGEGSGSMAVNGLMMDGSYIAAARIDNTTGTYGVGDNSNALVMADRQYAATQTRQWSFDRGHDAISRAVSMSTGDYYKNMIGSIGVYGQNLELKTQFSDTMVSQLTQQRDSVSGVSLDEEMVNMIKYQQAFSAASKLLSVADEMISTLINVK